MNRSIIAVLALAIAPAAAFANDQAVLDACIGTWGNSPFKKGKKADHVVGTGVKVFGIGSAQSGGDQPTSSPVLVYVRPAVNVMGKSTIRLVNPNGWYCFRSNVTVAGKIEIQAHCKAHLASAKEDGTAVGAVDESNKGVAVFGALRVERFDCPEGKK